MSLLLDALNKADEERKRNETTPGISSNHEQRGGDDEESRGYSLPLIIAGVIGLGILLVAIYWLGQRSTATAPTPATNPSAPAVETKPAVTNNAKPIEPQPQPEAPSNVTPPKAEDNVADLYQQQTQVPDSNAAITISAPPAQAPVEQAPVSPENIASPKSIKQFTNLPELHALPNNILDKVPTLTYSEHNYDPNGGSVKINGNMYRVNDQITNGIVIDQILEDGMILHIDSYSFKMRAMNSWINM